MITADELTSVQKQYLTNIEKKDIDRINKKSVEALEVNLNAETVARKCKARQNCYLRIGELF